MSRNVLALTLCVIMIASMLPTFAVAENPADIATENLVSEVAQVDLAVVEPKVEEPLESESVTEEAADETILPTEEESVSVAEAKQEDSVSGSEDAETIPENNEELSPVMGEALSDETPSDISLGEQAAAEAGTQPLVEIDPLSLPENEPEAQPNFTEEVQQAEDVTANLSAESTEDTAQLAASYNVDFGSWGDNLTWALDDSGTLTFSGSGIMEDARAVNMRPWYDYLTQIKTVIIDSRVTSIGDYAFYGCSELTQVTLPSNITRIGEYAFLNCSSLPDISIPNTVKSIGKYAFDGCTGFTSVTVSGNVTSIGEFAFFGCSSLTSVVLSEGATCIGKAAFSDCNALTSVTIPNSVTNIGEYAFMNCSSLKNVTLPDQLTSIENGLFCQCTSLTNVNIPKNITSIGDSAFSRTKISAFEIPESVSYIGELAFQMLDGLTNITLPENLTYLGSKAFNLCQNLTSITIPSKVTSIGEGTFSCCFNLTSVTFKGNITNISKQAFHNCTRLKSITIPASVTDIGSQAFINCVSLSTIYFTGNAPTINGDAFSAVTATAYYPANKNWPDSMFQNYGGTITWINGESTFTDVTDSSAYYYTPVYWAVESGITAGTSPTTFSPSKTCTRGQIVTFLWKALGSPEPSSTNNPFTDVSSGDYFYKSVLWAKESGITAGKTATTFEPYSPCTRGQIVTFLWKALGSPEPSDTSNPFTDVTANDYFYKPVLWAKENGVTSGTSATTFSPGKACTRAQAMTFLYKALA